MTRALQNVRLVCVRWLPLLAAMGAIYHFSTNPAPEAPLDWPHQDKLVHFAVYAVLGVLWTRACGIRNKKMRLWFGLLAAGSYGAAIEICQMHCGRHFEVGDILANFAGAGAGVWCYLGFVDKELRRA